MANQRLIFQNFNLYVGPAALSGTTATGALYTSGNSGANLIAQLSRVQNSTLTIGLNRQDVYEQGQLARIDSTFISPPTIGLDFSYYLTNGYNEQMLGFNTNGGSFLSGILTQVSDSKNYFISVSPQGVDDDGYTSTTQRNVFAVGNGYISNYSISAAVGQLATASVTVDGLNAGSWTGTSGVQTPAINTDTDLRATWLYQLPVGSPITGGNIVSALRPADIDLYIPAGAGFLTSLSGSNTARIQSFTLSLPLSRETLNQLGSFYGYSRAINFPINATLNLRAIATDVVQNSFDQLICSDVFYSMQIIMSQPGCNGTGAQAIVLGINNAKLTNWSQSNTLGSDSSVDLNFSCTVGGPNSLQGISFSGYY